MKVAKFGGSSLADAAQVSKVCQIVAADPERRFVVVSAPGARFKGDTKVTDLLIKCGKRYLKDRGGANYLKQVVARYAQICCDLQLCGTVMDDISADLYGRLDDDASDPDRFMDSLKAAGEDNSARLVAAALRGMGVSARYVSPREAGLVLSPEAGNARVLPESYPNMAKLRRSKSVVVFPGFFGHEPDGHVVTFPRGGSDITGSILARAVRADLYENWTDVDSVAVVDPKIVENGAPIKELTFQEMRELAYTGFSVFNDEALAPVQEKGIPVCIKNTNNPAAQGTLIVEHREVPHGEIVGIASKSGFCTIMVRKYLMNREVGFVRKLLSIIESENISYEHAPTGIDDIAVVLAEKPFTPAIERRIRKRIKDKLNPGSIEVQRGRSLLMIVGEGMRDTPGLAARATGALAKAGVNIEMMNQGGSQVSMMFGVLSEDRVPAVKAIYKEFFGKGK